MRLLLPLFAVMLVLSGCNRLGQNTGPVMTEVAANKPHYCYRTLADADCYDHPMPGQSYRLVNYYGPAPIEAGFAGK